MEHVISEVGPSITVMILTVVISINCLDNVCHQCSRIRRWNLVAGGSTEQILFMHNDSCGFGLPF